MVLLFDLDNTLINRDLAYKAWVLSLLKELKIDYTAKDMELLLEKDDSGYTTRGVFFSFLKEIFDIPLSIKELLEKSINELHKFVPPIEQNTQELLLHLAKSYTLGILSNGGVKNQWAKIKAAKLNDFIEKDYIFISAEVGFEKPDLNCFKYVESQLKTSRITLVGDHPVNDIQGAHAAGWQTVWINHGRVERVPADFNINSLTELKDLF